VSNPFSFTIPLASVTKKSGQAPDVRSYADSWGSAASLDAFSGYAVPDTASGDTLFISPDLSTSPLPKTVAARDSITWSLRLAASIRGALDDDNMVVASPSASEGVDALDRPKPPMIGEYVSLSFPHPEWNSVFTRYSTDARPVPGEGGTWNFEVVSNIPDRVTLRFEGLSSLPETWVVRLLDGSDASVKNLRSGEPYSFFNSPTGQARHFNLVIGSPSYADNAVNELGPSSFQLMQNYPNPFNPSTTIRFAVPAPSAVTLTLFNVLGQRVATVLDEVVGRGVRSLEFSGNRLASGVYYCRMDARPVTGEKAFTSIITMMLVK
jgi:hypothetical protein